MKKRFFKENGGNRMINSILFIVNNKKYLEGVEKSRAILKKKRISTSLSDETEHKVDSLAFSGGHLPTKEILTSLSCGLAIIISVAVTAGLEELGKDIYNQIKKIGKKLFRKNETKSPKEIFLLSLDIGNTPNCVYDFYFCTDDFKEILQGTSDIPKIIIGFESMRQNLEFVPSFMWDKDLNKWSLCLNKT